MEPRLVPAKIVEIRQETPRVKSFILKIDSTLYGFLPGQSVDLHLDDGGHTKIGGYSPTSSPLQHDLVELAVRRAYRDPASCYLYERARVGENVFISEGQGEFIYHCDLSRSIVLIGGGIGLAPLMSIIRYARQACPDSRVHLLYSIRDPDEFLYRQELIELEKDWPSFRLWVTVTGSRPGFWQGPVGRINLDVLLRQALDPLALFYLCGPPALVKTLTTALATLGVPLDQIRFESWSV